MNSPYIARPTSVSSVMMHVIAAMTLGIAGLVTLFGISVLIQIALAASSALAAEALCLKIRGLPIRPYLRDGSALVTGVLIAVAFPPLGAWWLVVVASAFAIILIKHIYGGLGNNLFNPAMAAYAMMLISFPAQMSQWSPIGHGLDAMQQITWIFLRALPANLSLDAISSATPLDIVRTQLLSNQGLQNLDELTWSQSRLGLALAWVLGGLYLWQRKIIDWRAPVAMLSTLALLALLFHSINPTQYPTAPFYLLHGATLLGAFFIITDPVSCSTTPLGKLIFGAGVGALVFIIRTWGNFPDAMAFAVLIMNITVPFLDRYTRPPAFGKRGRV